MIVELAAAFLAGAVVALVLMVWVGTASIHRRLRKERQGARVRPDDPGKVFVQTDERPVVRRNGKGGGPDAKVPIGEDVIGVVTKGG